MPVETTRDVIDQARAFHRQLRDVYSQLQEKAHKERIKLLLEYMSAHEVQLEENLEAFEEVANKQVLDSWFQYPPEQIHQVTVDGIKNIDDLTIDDIINLALKFDDMLLNFYQESADKAELRSAKDVFNNLVAEQQQARRTFVRQILRTEDM